jgi:hypothetical protein
MLWSRSSQGVRAWAAAENFEEVASFAVTHSVFTVEMTGV